MSNLNETATMMELSNLFHHNHFIEFNQKIYEIAWLDDFPQVNYFLENFVLIREKGKKEMGVVKILFNNQNKSKIKKFFNEKQTDLKYILQFVYNYKLIVPVAYYKINIIWEMNKVTYPQNKLYFFIVEKNQKYGIYDINGNLSAPIIFDRIKIKKEERNCLEIISNNLVGIFNIKTNQIIISPIFKSIQSLGDKYYKCYNGSYYGVLIPNNFILIPIIFDNIIFYSKFNDNNEGFICQKNGLLGFINNKGFSVLSVIYEDIKPSSNGFICKLNGKYGLVSLNGLVTIPFIYEEIKLSDENLWVLNKKIDVINNNEKAIITFAYEEITIIDKDTFRVKKNNKYGLINNNKGIILPIKYDYLKSFINGTYIFILGGKKGIINEKNEILINNKYEEIKIFDNYFLASEDISSDEGILFNFDGERLKETLYFDEIVYRYDYLIKIRKGGKLGLINKEGEILENYTEDSMKVMKTYWHHLDKVKESRNERN